MTRAEFLNSLYRRLGSLDKEQAEQHLTYYAEMLMDRMEEGMSEEEAVASMEDVETIASRILQEEPSADAPRFPDMPKGETGQFTHVPGTPRRDWRKPAQIALWTVAIAVALGSVGSRLVSKAGTAETTAVDACETAPVQQIAEDYGIAVTEGTFTGDGLVIGGVRISPKGIEGDNFSITPDGIIVTGGEHEVYVGPEGVFVNGPEGVCIQGAEAEPTPGGVLCGTWEIPAADVDAIYVDWIVGDVAVRGYDGETIRLQQYADEFLTENQKLSPRLEDGVLSIDSPPVESGQLRTLSSMASLASTGSPSGKSGLLLLLPENAVRELSVDAYSNNVVLEIVAADRLYIGTTSGNVSLSGAAAKTLSVETTSGSVSLRYAGAETLSISCCSGNTRLENVAAGSFSLDGTSGDVTGALAVRSGYVSTSSGDVSLTASSGELVVDTTSGNVALELPEGASTLNVDTSSGDVRLNWPWEQGFLLTYDSASGRLRGADKAFASVDGSYQWGDGSCQIYVDTSSGNLTFS